MELNHRSQACDVLAGTGVRVAKKNPKRTESGIRPLVRPGEVSAGTRDSLGKWTGMRVARPLFRFERSLQTATTCFTQHLCRRKWNPVLESHQPLRFCKPPPELLGQRDAHLTSKGNFDQQGPKVNQISPPRKYLTKIHKVV